MSSYVPLHIHSEYSTLDGFIKIPELVAKCKESGIRAVAVSDHGSLGGLLELYNSCKKAEIKPIVGMEAYFVDDRFDKAKGSPPSQHLNIYVKNKPGFSNLLRIGYEGYNTGAVARWNRTVPRIDWEVLENNKGGLIGTSSCRAGMIQSLLLEDKEDEAAKVAERYCSIFDSFFFEIMPVIDEDQKKVNERVIRLAKRMKIPILCTTDSHYLNPEDRDAHQLLLAIQSKKSIDDPDRFTFEAAPFLSEKQMIEQFGEETVKNTSVLAEMCEQPDFILGTGIKTPIYDRASHRDYKEFKDWLVKNWDADRGEEDYAFLTFLCEKGFVKKNLQRRDNASEYVQRMKTELEMIRKTNIVNYMLIVHDYVVWAKEQSIRVGPARGSCAGCLCSWLLDITVIDPIKYDLLFERFVNPGRSEENLADIDVDFQDTRRDEVKRYLERKYGVDCVASISTYGQMKLRACVQDVVRSLSIGGEKSHILANEITKTIPEDPEITYAMAVNDSAEFLEYMDKYPEVAKYVQKFEGVIRQTGIHAAGIIISAEPLTNNLPLVKQKGVVATAYDGEALASVGYLKVDLLGLKTLSIIDDTVKNIAKVGDEFDRFYLTGLEIGPDLKEKFEAETNEYVKKATRAYAMLRRGETEGVFQLESEGMKQLLREIKVNSIEEISAVLALHRPGPLEVGLTQSYAKRKHGLEKIEYPHPDVENILKKTMGIACFQEQIMMMASELAGYTLAEADELRKAIGKKKADLMTKNKEKFVQGFVKCKNASQKEAETLWDQIERFASYSFNASHSVSYSHISFMTAYLKANYRACFWGALLSYTALQETRNHYINCAKLLGIRFLPADVNESGTNYVVVSRDDIRRDLASLKGIGEAAVEEIIKVREENGKYKSFLDFLTRVESRKVNSRVLKVLIDAGAFDTLGVNRKTLSENLEPILGSLKKYKANILKWEKKGEEILPFQFEMISFEDWTLKEVLEKEEAVYGTWVSCHIFDEYPEEEDDKYLTPLATVFQKVHGQKVKVMGFVKCITKKLSFVTNYLITDRAGEVELGVYSRSETNLKEGSIVKVIAKVNRAKEKYKKLDFLRLEKIVKK